MQAPAVCQLYGTVAGCRRGKRCQNLHVQDDGGLAKTKASPMTEHGYADSFRNRMLTLMREFLRQQGSTTEVLGASFRDGAKTVRFTVRTTEQPSHCSYMVAAGSLQYRDGAVGNGSFHIQPAMIGNDAVFFHGTDVHSGMSILSTGKVIALEQNSPIGFYTTLEFPSEVYYQGCAVEVVSIGKLLSLAETRTLCDTYELPFVPEGLIAAAKRSIREYIHHPRSISILAVTFDTKLLSELFRIDEARLPSSMASASSLLVPKAAAIARVRAKASASSLLVPKAAAIARVTRETYLHRHRSRSPRPAPRTPPGGPPRPAPRTPPGGPRAVVDEDEMWGNWAP